MKLPRQPLSRQTIATREFGPKLGWFESSPFVLLSLCAFIELTKTSLYSNFYKYCKTTLRSCLTLTWTRLVINTSEFWSTFKYGGGNPAIAFPGFDFSWIRSFWTSPRYTSMSNIWSTKIVQRTWMCVIYRCVLSKMYSRSRLQIRIERVV